MFLATASDWPTPDPPIYFVSGDVAIWLQDTQSVVAFSRVGIPTVLLSTEGLTSLTGDLDPYLEYPVAKVPPIPTQPQFLPITDPVVNGGEVDTIYAGGAYDGGTSSTDQFVTALDIR